jgi:hypothetical protein
MALLSIGAAGPQVKQLQEFLNLLPTALPKLDPDGQFGSRTQARVREFQGDNGLSPDGIVGPLTMGVIEEALRLLRLMPVPKPPPAVRLITEEVLGSFPATDNLIQQVLPAFPLINELRFVAGRPEVPFEFRVFPPTVGRLAIFAAQKGNDERAVILLLPASSRPDRILIHITQGFAQAINTVGPLGFAKPISPPLIQFCLLKHIINRYGPQTLAGRKNMGLMYIVRAAGKELGPFANDGPFVRQVLNEMAALTNNGFATDTVEAFTFSSGIVDFNPFVNAIQSQVKVAAVYNIDPSHTMDASVPSGAVRKQYLSGQTGAPRPGFEFAPRPRWKNEDLFIAGQKETAFNYLHNYALPKYMLFLAIQTS